jgi:hypothetical protein
MVLFAGLRQNQIRRKAKAVVYNFVFKDFRDAITDRGQMSIFLRPLRAVQSRIPAALSTYA